MRVYTVIRCHRLEEYPAAIQRAEALGYDGVSLARDNDPSYLVGGGGCPQFHSPEYPDRGYGGLPPQAHGHRLRRLGYPVPLGADDSS